MSKFFEGLDDEGVKKIAKTVKQRAEEEESGEETGVVSNKERKHEEIAKMCKETDLRKTKEAEAFFKKLSKYQSHFSKDGVPEVLMEYLSKADVKGLPSVVKQKRAKFLEKYATTEITIEVVEKKKEKEKYIDQINKTLLEENLQARERQLRELEKIEGLTGVEQHRVNLYMLGCLADNIEKNYSEILRRIEKEVELAQEEEEKNIFRTRIKGYTRRIIRYVHEAKKQGKNWREECEKIREVAKKIKPLCNTLEKGALEICYFMERGAGKTEDGTENGRADKIADGTENVCDAGIDIEEYPLFAYLERIRRSPYPEALRMYREIEKQRPEEENTTDEVCYSKIEEELGHIAFKEKDYDSAIELLEKAYYLQNMWSLTKTEVVLNVLSLCFENRVRGRKYFELFKKSLQGVGTNLLLLKTESPKDEIARAFIFLHLGEYEKSAKVIEEIIPGFECRKLLKARALEYLLCEQG